jgi:hypothetical protein
MTSFNSAQQPLRRRGKQSKRNNYKVTFVPLPWFSNITLETSLSFVNAVAGRLPGFTWNCNTSTTYVLPMRKKVCACHKRESAHGYREFKDHEFCEDELFELCSRQNVRASDKVLWPTERGVATPQCLVEVSTRTSALSLGNANADLCLRSYKVCLLSEGTGWRMLKMS